MKKKNKKNHIRMRFSTLLLCCLAIVLCAAPRGWAFNMYCTEDGVYYDGDDVYCDDEDGKYDVTEQLINTVRDELDLEGELDMLEVGAGATVNLYTDVSESVYVYPGGILNIYSGSVVWFVIVSPPSPDETNAVVTVYGTGFEDKLGPVDYGQWKPDGGADTLMGQYKYGSPINLLIWSNTPINLQQPPPNGDLEKITIDIKPGGNPNNINLKSRGVVPVAVLTTLTTDDADGFDAGTIDPETVLFAGASPVRWKLCDVDGDGNDDMLFHFKTKDLELNEDSTEATLTGETTQEEKISGTDKVWIVPRKKK